MGPFDIIIELNLQGSLSDRAHGRGWLNRNAKRHEGIFPKQRKEKGLLTEEGGHLAGRL